MLILVIRLYSITTTADICESADQQLYCVWQQTLNRSASGIDELSTSLVVVPGSIHCQVQLRQLHLVLKCIWFPSTLYNTS